LRTWQNARTTVWNWTSRAAPPHYGALGVPMFRPIFLLMALAVMYAAPVPHLMPMPAKTAVNPGHLRIDANFRVAVSGTGLDGAIERLTARVLRQSGLS